jgi:hypothetical protein
MLIRLPEDNTDMLFPLGRKLDVIRIVRTKNTPHFGCAL